MFQNSTGLTLTREIRRSCCVIPSEARTVTRSREDVDALSDVIRHGRGGGSANGDAARSRCGPVARIAGVVRVRRLMSVGRLVELADTTDSRSVAFGREGSIPSATTGVQVPTST